MGRVELEFVLYLSIECSNFTPADVIGLYRSACMKAIKDHVEKKNDDIHQKEPPVVTSSHLLEAKQSVFGWKQEQGKHNSLTTSFSPFFSSLASTPSTSGFPSTFQLPSGMTKESIQSNLNALASAFTFS